MFLEKFSRFFRRYDLHFHPRHKAGKHLPMDAPRGSYSVIDALRVAQRGGKASVSQPNGDTVELVSVEVLEKKKAAVLLFHRSSPNAADPMYRKREKEKMSVRQARRELNEEQTVSAHLIIELTPYKAGSFKAALEEIPGLSLSIVQSIVGPALRDYKYGFKDKKGEESETYSFLKVEGIKSESLSQSLDKQTLNYITLSRTLAPDAPDGEGIVEPMNDRMRYRIKGNPADPDWFDRLERFVKNARSKGWQGVSLDLTMDDSRNRTVKLDRNEEAKEIFFVRSEHVSVKTELKPCTTTIVEELVDHAIAIMKKL